MNIKALENYKDTLQSNHKVICGICEEEFYSPFDKLYIDVYEGCYDCDKSGEDELERRSNNIFKVINN